MSEHYVRIPDPANPVGELCTEYVQALERLAKAAVAMRTHPDRSLSVAQWSAKMHDLSVEYDAALEAVRKVMP